MPNRQFQSINEAAGRYLRINLSTKTHNHRTMESEKDHLYFLEPLSFSDVMRMIDY